MLARLAFLVTLCFVSLAHAEPLRIDRSQEKMRVDGALLEWRGAHFRELGSGEDARLRFAIASVDGGLYLGAEVYDDALVTGGDVLVITLAMPVDAGGSAREPKNTKGVDASEVALYPGQGSVRARATISRNGAAQSDNPIQIVEGPLARGQGYVIEAFVPWNAIAGSENWRDGLGALRFVDVDAMGAPLTLRSDPETRPAQLPRLSLGIGQEDLLGSFLSDHDLVGVPPRYDLRENVAGDTRKERVVIIGQYVIVFGPGFKNGESYSYNILPFSPDGGLRNAALIDLTGDGRLELVATGRQSNQLGLREAWVVIELEELGMRQLFGIELKKESKGGFLDNSVVIIPGQGKALPRIEQKLGRALGLDATTYRETPATDVQPVLLPWGEIVERTFGYDGKKFSVVEEKKRALPSAAVASAPVAAEVALTPRSAPDRAALVAQFKQQQGLPGDAKPSQSLRANVFGAAAPEQIEVFGRLLLFTGPDVGNGAGFMSYGAPVSDPRELLDVRAADVTGDAQAELLLRIRQTLTGADGVQRELLAVLRADAEGRFARVLLVEIARRQDTRAIENQLAIKDGALTISPGVAKGWAANAYPFTNDATGGAQRLLLPWLDKPVRYRFSNGALLAAEP